MDNTVKRATVWLAHGLEEMEAVIAIDVLRRGGIDVKGMAIGDELEIKGGHDLDILADCFWDDDWVAGSDLLVCPGGMGGMEALRADSRVLEHLRRAANEGRVVAAVCAGPLVLAAAGVLKGRRATCYPSLESELTGATTVDQRVVVDGNVITSQGPATAMEFAVALVGAVQGADTATKVAEGLLLN